MLEARVFLVFFIIGKKKYYYLRNHYKLKTKNHPNRNNPSFTIAVKPIIKSKVADD